MQVKERNKMHRVKEGTLLIISLKFLLIFEAWIWSFFEKEEEDEEERESAGWRGQQGEFLWLPTE